MDKKLKFGLVVSNKLICRWMEEMIVEIQQISFIDLVLILIDSVPDNSKKNKSFLFKKYIKFDNKLFNSNAGALNTRDIQVYLAGNKIEHVFYNLGEASVSEIETQRIKNLNIDVFFFTEHFKLSSKFFGLSKFGIWTYQIGENQYNFPGFWELMENAPKTKVSIVSLAKNGAKIGTVAKSAIPTDEHSTNRNHNNALFRLVYLVTEVLLSIKHEDVDRFFSNMVHSIHPDFNYYRKKNYPSNLKMIQLLYGWGWQRLKTKLYKIFFRKKWILLYSFNSSLSTNLSEFKRIYPPKNMFWADPQVIQKDGEYFLFFEELKFSNEKGFLSVVKINEDGLVGKPTVILEKEYHLSYPFVFCVENQYYMIPESNENNSVDLYKCNDFPNIWHYEKTILNNVKAVDSTILYLNNMYWLFVNIQKNSGTNLNEELFLFHSDNLLNDNWISHPQNPIVIGLEKSRPAGRLFFYNGKLYRPSQDCDKWYGYSIRIHEVIQIDVENYLEKEVSEIFPLWDTGLYGVHTISFEDQTNCD